MKKPGLFISLVPILTLILLLFLGVRLFGEDLTGGPAQIALLLSAVIACIIGMTAFKVPWSRFEDAMGDTMKSTTGAIFILFAIGCLTATWMLSGIVPTMIAYGLKIISPKVFILVSFLLCALVSVLAGSSWTTIGTIGVAMFTAGTFVGLPSGWLAGAIISGAYLGDKVSPLSDTTNLSASIAGAELYTHVKFNMITSLPALVICLIVFLVVGFLAPVTSDIDVSAELEVLRSTFDISPWLLLVPVVTILLIYKKVSAFLTLFLSAIVGAVVAWFAQPQIMHFIIGDQTGLMGFIKAAFAMMSNEVSIETSSPLITKLASTGGMGAMVDTVWLIIAVMAFSGAFTASGMLGSITERLVGSIKSVTGLVTTTVFTCIFCNLTLSDQYMAILVPGNMFKDVYKKFGLAPEMLSRTLQDSATVSSVLVPWNTCAVVQSTVLGIATIEYLPFSIFCLIAPFIAIIIAALNYKIHRLPEYETH